MIVCRLKRFNVTVSHLACILQGRAAPGKTLATELHDEKVCHKPGMSAVAVWERVNVHKTVMIRELRSLGYRVELISPAPIA